jgi:hypothetical protein
VVSVRYNRTISGISVVVLQRHHHPSDWCPTELGSLPGSPNVKLSSPGKHKDSCPVRPHTYQHHVLELGRLCRPGRCNASIAKYSKWVLQRYSEIAFGRNAQSAPQAYDVDSVPCKFSDRCYRLPSNDDLDMIFQKPPWSSHITVLTVTLT